MRKIGNNRLAWMVSIGLLGLLGFASCSPRLHPRKAPDPVDTLRVPRPDTLAKPLPGDYPPAKLMYGVPPVRFETMAPPVKEQNNDEG